MASLDKHCPLYCSKEHKCSAVNKSCCCVTQQDCDLLRMGYERGTKHSHRHHWGWYGLLHLVGHILIHVVIHLIIHYGIGG